MSALQVIYLLVAAATLACAYGVVTSAKLMHSALWLGATFVGMAAIFVLLEADFLAAAQILIYVGAITTMILFGIMLSDIRDLRPAVQGPWWSRVLRVITSPRRGLLPLLASVAFTGALWLVTARTPWPLDPPPAPGSVTTAIGETMFGQYVIPFEVASVLLLVALVGAVVLSMREEAEKR